MEDKYYITNNLFYNKGKMYFISKNDKKIKKIKVSNQNWCRCLNDYGWIKLSLSWRNKLDSRLFSVLECGSNGDCLFHVFAEGLNNEKIYNWTSHKKDNSFPDLYDIVDIRKFAAEKITDHNFIPIIENYRCDDDFIGFWDPEETKTKEQLKIQIEETGDNFWGDHIILQLLQEYFKLNVILLNSENTDIQQTGLELNKYDETIIINYIEGCHFQLIGYFNGSYMKTIFKKDEIPKEIVNLTLYNVIN